MNKYVNKNLLLSKIKKSSKQDEMSVLRACVTERDSGEEITLEF